MKDNRYRTTLELPGDIQTFFEAINGIASCHKITDSHVVIEFVEPSEYNLALHVRELQDELQSHYGSTPDIDRPISVEVSNG